MFETHGQMYGWWSCLGKDLNLPSVYCLSQDKVRQGSMSPQGCRTMGTQVFVPPANPGLFCHMCMVQGWQICCLTELLPSSLLCREMPTRICVDPRQRVLCVRHSVLHVLQNRFVCKWCWPLPWFGLLEKRALRRHPPPSRQHCDFCNLHVVLLT